MRVIKVKGIKIMRILLSILALTGGVPTAVIPSVAGFVQNSHQNNTTQSSAYESLDQINDSAYIEGRILAQENRSYQHSYLTPTGYFLEKGKEYKVEINKNAQANDLLYLSIGQYGSYQGLNDGKNAGFETKQIIGNQVVITPQNSGMLYLKDYRFTNEVKILTISNDPIKVPTFIIDQTNQTDFFNEIAKTNSFFVEVISEHVFGTFQTQMFKSQVVPASGVNINESISAWDKVWDYTNEVYGLKETYSGTAKKHPQFIQIANPDTGAGYAYATNYYVSFQKQTNASRDLFTRRPSDQWGLWHEIGHTYQTPQYNWSGLGEVTVNISSLYVQQKLVGGESRVDQPALITKMKQLFATPIANKDYNSQSDLFVKVAMFWQLQMAFGDNFYPTLAQLYRTDYVGVADKQQAFVQITSKLVNRNLLPFFEKWGVKVSDETKTIVSKLPPLKTNIWENIINGTHQPRVEWQLPEYQISTIRDTITAKKVINFGAVINKDNFADNFDFGLNKDLQTDEVYFDWMSYYIKDNKYYVPVRFMVRNGQDLKNGYWSYVQVSFENSIALIGYAYYQRGFIGLNPSTHQFYFAGSRIGLDVTQKPNIYYTITVRDRNNQLIKEFTLTGADNVSDTIKRYDLLNINYQEGYTLEIKTKVINKSRLFDKTQNTWVGVNGYDIKYKINNDILIRI